MAKPKLSIITVSLNAAQALERTIKSIIQQSFTDYELLIIDGGSKDHSTQIFTAYQDQISWWISEPDEGIYFAMNKGLKQAKGDWIYFLNAGDELNHSESLSQLESYFNDQYHLVYGDVCLVDKEKRKTLWKQKMLWQNGLFNNICHQAVFYNKKSIGSFHFDTKFKISADARLLLELSQRCKPIRYQKVHKAFVKYEAEGLSKDLAFTALEERKIHFKDYIQNPMIKWINQLNLRRQMIKYKLNNRS